MLQDKIGDIIWESMAKSNEELFVKNSLLSRYNEVCDNFTTRYWTHFPPDKQLRPLLCMLELKKSFENLLAKEKTLQNNDKLINFLQFVIYTITTVVDEARKETSLSHEEMLNLFLKVSPV